MRYIMYVQRKWSLVGSVHAYGKHIILYSLYYVACLVCQSASQTSMESLHAEEVLVKMFEVKKLFNQVGCTCRCSIFEDEFKGKSCMLSHELLPHVGPCRQSIQPWAGRTAEEETGWRHIHTDRFIPFHTHMVTYTQRETHIDTFTPSHAHMVTYTHTHTHTHTQHM